MISQGIDPRVQKAERISKAIAQNANKESAIYAWDAYLEAKSKKWSDRYITTHKQYSREGGEKITRGIRVDGHSRYFYVEKWNTPG